MDRSGIKAPISVRFNHFRTVYRMGHILASFESFLQFLVLQETYSGSEQCAVIELNRGWVVVRGALKRG